MALLAEIGLCVVLAWIICGLHAEGVRSVRTYNRRTASYPFRRPKW